MPDNDDNGSKPWWASSTIWLNGITIVTAMLTGLGYGFEPEDIAAITGLVTPILNVLLRVFVTSRPIQ